MRTSCEHFCLLSFLWMLNDVILFLYCRLSDVLSSINNRPPPVSSHFYRVPSPQLPSTPYTMNIKLELGSFDDVVKSSPLCSPRRGDPNVVCSSQPGQMDIAERLSNLQVTLSYLSSSMKNTRTI